MLDPFYDIAIVGGGINGAGIARDAAGRGLKVLLVEKNDFASATSSASSKLIHGGLRYLEQYEFRLVREALAEREVLLSIAPHITWPLRFVLPHNKLLRPAWMLRIGLFLYDNLAPRSKLQRSHGIDLRADPAGRPLKAELTRGFDYADGWVEDSRLVVLNAMSAAEKGATILPRTECVSARKAASGEGWDIVLKGRDGAVTETKAKVLVNAAGPWVADVLTGVMGRNGESRLRLVKGSHIVVPAIHDGPEAYILQNPDGRVVFAIPYQGRFTLIGTTDIPYEGDPGQVAIDADEVAYLCEAVNRYFTKTTRPQDVVWTYSGVRPLYDDSAANPSAVTRDYVFDVVGGEDGEPVLLSIFGGKITTYRRLAEHAMEKLQPHLPSDGAGWTGREPLPGGDMPGADFDAFLVDLARRYPGLPADLLRRYARAYGTRATRILGQAQSVADLGRDFGAGLHEAELAYLSRDEWAMTGEDVLWRRTKLGLHIPRERHGEVDAWFAGRTSAVTPRQTRPAARG